jgi:nitroreductase
VNVLEAIKKRRSVRRFLKEDIPEDTMMELLEAMRWAPSAGNLQPWEFVVVRDAGVKGRVAEAARQDWIAEAPVVVVVCASPDRSSPRYGDRGISLYCLQDTAAAVQNLHLAAVEKGLGTCWVGAFDESGVAQAVGAPRGIRPVAVVPVGRPAEMPVPRPRRSLEEVVHRDRF